MFLESNSLEDVFQGQHTKTIIKAVEDVLPRFPLDSRSWKHCPHVTGSVGIKYARSKGLQNLVSWFWRATDVQAMCFSVSLKRGPKRPMYEAMKIRPNLKRRSQDVEEARTIVH